MHANLIRAFLKMTVILVFLCNSGIGLKAQNETSYYFSAHFKSGVKNFGWNNDAIIVSPAPIFAFQIGVGVKKPLGSTNLSIFSDINLGGESNGRNIKLAVDQNIYSGERTSLYHGVVQVGFIFDLNDKLNFRLSFHNCFMLPTRYKSYLEESQSAANTIRLDRNYHGYYVPRVSLMVGKLMSSSQNTYFEAGIESNFRSKDITINRIIDGYITDQFTGRQYTALVVSRMTHYF